MVEVQTGRQGTDRPKTNGTHLEGTRETPQAGQEPHTKRALEPPLTHADNSERIDAQKTQQIKDELATIAGQLPHAGAEGTDKPATITSRETPVPVTEKQTSRAHSLARIIYASRRKVSDETRPAEPDPRLVELLEKYDAHAITPEEHRELRQCDSFLADQIRDFQRLDEKNTFFEERRRQRHVPEEEAKKLREVLDAYKNRPLTAEEWKVLDFNPYLDDFFASLPYPESLKWNAEQQEFLRNAMSKRGAAMIKDMMKDRYPDWWKVYDKDGNRIWKMPLPHKALLAKWRRFDSLPPDVQWEILRTEVADMQKGHDEHPRADWIAEAHKAIYMIAKAHAEAIRALMFPPEKETQNQPV